MTVETAEQPLAVRQRSFARFYVGAAILLLNTLLLFVLINLICWGILAVHQARARPSYLTYSDDWYRSVYPGMADSEWKELVRETKERPFAFAPYSMFIEPPYHGQYINVSEQGFRFVPNQGPWPMDPKNYNVMTFGGSTMFGYAASDDHTVSAYLQDILQKRESRRVCVYNFGQRAYFSTQERIRFEQLLRDGAKPDLVVFMDGLNDFLFAVEPTFLQQSKDELLAPAGAGTRLLEIWHSMPVAQAMQILLKKILPAPKTPPQPDWSVVDPGAIDRYVWNKKAEEAICASEDIPAVFIFQPMPIYNYDLELAEHDWNGPGDQWVVNGYPLMAKYIKDHDMGDDFLWLADIQKGNPHHLYVDKWHYNPELAGLIADETCKSLERRKLIP